MDVWFIFIVIIHYYHLSLTINYHPDGAANALSMSISNVSQNSTRFKHNLGVRMFAGDQRRSSIRPEAEYLINRFGPLLGEIDRLKEDLRARVSLLDHNILAKNLNMLSNVAEDAFGGA